MSFEGYANTGRPSRQVKLPAGTYYVILDYGDGKTECIMDFYNYNIKKDIRDKTEKI